MIPAGLDWLRDSEAGRTWLGSLPATLAACADRWNLDLGAPYDASYVSLVVPVNRAREQIVLKIQYPHRESEHEAAALARWGGNGAIRLIDHDAEANALLVERCDPGTHLSTTAAQVGLGAMIDLLPRLWVAASAPFGSLEDEVARWVHNLPEEWERAGEPFEHLLLSEAIDTLVGLAGSQGEQVLLHQDLHGDNVLRARREPWLAIDPKPLIGEREFGLSPIIRSYEFGHSRDAVVRRLDRLTGELGLDRDRARLWAFGQAVAWGFERGNMLPRHIETARWLLDV